MRRRVLAVLVSRRSDYGIPEDDESAARYIADVMQPTDVPRYAHRGKTPKPWRTSAKAPTCPICRKWLVPSIDHRTC